MLHNSAKAEQSGGENTMLVTEGDVAYLKRVYPDKQISMPSVRNQKILMLKLRGLSPGAIKRAMGADPDAGVDVPLDFLNTDTAKALIDLFRSREFKDVRCTREQLTNMLFESYHKAGSSMEEVAAIREIGKLNGLYKSDEQRSGVTINQIGNIQNVRQMERLSETELLQLVNGIQGMLDPAVLDAEPLPLPEYKEPSDE